MAYSSGINTFALSKFQQLLETLGLQEHYPNKLSLNKVLEINIEELQYKAPTCPKDIPWHFLRLLLGLNPSAREIQQPPADSTQATAAAEDDCFGLVAKTYKTASINPLDIITALLLCADTFLQQEVILKLSLCQFAVPIILPCPEGKPTFLLGPMRSIVRRYRPHSLSKKIGFIEESMATSELPTFAFTRLGRCSLSKSKMLNYIFSNSQPHLNYFVHSDMISGDVARKVSDGMIELCWYLPSGSQDIDIIPEPLAIMNLRGDALDFPEHFSFLSKVATAVFVFFDCLNEQTEGFLLSSPNLSQKLFLIPTPGCDQIEQTIRHLQNLSQANFIVKDRVLSKCQKNDAVFSKDVRSKIVEKMRSGLKGTAQSLQKMVSEAKESKFLIDEEETEIRRTRERSAKCIRSILNEEVKAFRETQLYFQGDVWEKNSDIEKKLCRPKSLGDSNVADYVGQLKKERQELCRGLVQRGMSEVMREIMQELQTVGVNRKLFLNYLRYDLDSRSRTMLHDQRALNREPEKQVQCQEIDDQLTEPDKNVGNSSLGLEHFLREMGLIYEVFQAVGTIPPDIKLFPSIAADLLLEGFPLELMDGDVSNIPVQWVSSVLEEVDRKVGPRSSLFVISVLGVQSTGKSTLLNTMFGSQFAVGSGRCTRGVNMQLLKTSGKIREQGCDFILILDTEGLEAQEMSDIGVEYEHDNELATLVCGLSDLTLINMSTETASEMKEVLEIVVHAFIRMKTVGKRPNCQFLHQKIGDVSAHQKNVESHKSIERELDQMTNIAAIAEKQDGKVSKFSDVLDYDSKKNNWYIPGLWCGTPPMAPVNVGYSQKVGELKENILQHFLNRRPSTITEFISWMKSTWDAVKHENFIFSFRNSLVANAYNQLSVKYSDLEWKMKSEVYSWLQKAHTRIRNCNGDLQELEDILKSEVLKVITEKKNQKLNEIEEYFKTDAAQAHLVERFKAEMSASFETECLELETSTKRKCREAVIRQKNLNKLNNILSTYTDKIQERVDQLLHKLKMQSAEQSESELNKAFEKMWIETMQSVEYQPQVIEIERDMETSLRGNMRRHGRVLTEKLASGTSLWDLSKLPLKISQHHIEASKRSLMKRILGKANAVYCKISNYWYYKVNSEKNMEEWVESDCLVEAKRIAVGLISQCKLYVEETVKNGEDYHPLLCQELLREIDAKLQKADGDSFQVNELFSTDVKIQICGYAVQRFQEKHDRFCDEHNTVKRLTSQKNYYFTIFKCIYSEKDQSETCAKLFCDSFLKPALLKHLNQVLGYAIVCHIRDGPNAEFESRRNLQVGIMLDLRKQNSFEAYCQYIENTQNSEQEWVRKQVLNHCKRLENQKSTIYRIAAKILKEKVQLMQTMIEDIKKSSPGEIELFLKDFKHRLGEHVVLPQGRDHVFKNAPRFVMKLTDYVQGLDGSLLQSIKGWDIEEKVSNLSTDPSSELYKMLCGCGEHCPFCRVPCDITTKIHEKHSATYHWPQGIGGCNWRWSKELATGSCQATASDLYCYRTEGESYWQRFTRTMMGIFGKAYIETQCKRSDSWNIPFDLTAEIPPYWKWVLFTYNKQFAEKYNVLPATDISDWNIPWEKITAELEAEYDVKIDESSIRPTQRDQEQQRLTCPLPIRTLSKC
ncbi:interferon-induced very large GTPase 1-like [Scyliorhinus canicula]|uniref:interferon-induced very large GTPase 1-like n=1 Tax=Scyliorhinus canicula TaxID=7830 RepID=UPI0018F3AAF0|nr:interferon-induced very large GTPase 1-like [Scyliorhinus canicula]